MQCNGLSNKVVLFGWPLKFKINISVCCMMAHKLHNIIFEISTNSIERKDVFMKRQLVFCLINKVIN